MIYLTLKKIPDGENTVGLYEKALASFKRCPENSSYIDTIRNRCDKSAAEGLFALCLLSELINRADEAPMSDTLTLARTDVGKPYFVSSDWQFNISHSGGYVAVALSDEGAVGIDVETADITADKAQKLAKRFFTESEQCAVAADSSEFCRLWSKKEAAAKYLGTSLQSFLCGERKGAPAHQSIATETHSINGITVTLCRAANSKTSVVILA